MIKLLNKQKLIFILLVTLLSCEKEAYIKIPQPTPRLVINSILIPNQDIEIYITESKYALNDEKNRIITDATVKLFCNDQYLISLTHTKNGIYTHKGLKPISGNTYSIEVLIL